MIHPCVGISVMFSHSRKSGSTIFSHIPLATFAVNTPSDVLTIIIVHVLIIRKLLLSSLVHVSQARPFTSFHLYICARG